MKFKQPFFHLSYCDDTCKILSSESCPNIFLNHKNIITQNPASLIWNEHIYSFAHMKHLFYFQMKIMLIQKKANKIPSVTVLPIWHVKEETFRISHIYSKTIKKRVLECEDAREDKYCEIRHKTCLRDNNTSSTGINLESFYTNGQK